MRYREGRKKKEDDIMRTLIEQNTSHIHPMIDMSTEHSTYTHA